MSQNRQSLFQTFLLSWQPWKCHWYWCFEVIPHQLPDKEYLIYTVFKVRPFFILPVNFWAFWWIPGKQLQSDGSLNFVQCFSGPFCIMCLRSRCCVWLLAMSMAPTTYQQPTPAAPLYPLKPDEVPIIPPNYTNGPGNAAGYPAGPSYPPTTPAQPPGR